MFKNILLPIDLEEESLSGKLLSATVEICKSDGATLRVLTVLPGYNMSIVSQYFPKNFEEEALATVKQKLKDYIAASIPSEISSKAIIASGTVYEEILRVAKESGSDLIVIGAHRPDLKDFLLGPNAARVVRHADCSVLVVRD